MRALPDIGPAGFDMEHIARFDGCYVPPADDPAPLTVAGLLRDTFGLFAMAFFLAGFAALVWLSWAFAQ